MMLSKGETLFNPQLISLLERPTKHINQRIIPKCTITKSPQPTFFILLKGKIITR